MAVHLGEQRMQEGPGGGINTKLHVAVDSHVPIRFQLTAGNQADCIQGIPLVEGISSTACSG